MCGRVASTVHRPDRRRMTGDRSDFRPFPVWQRRVSRAPERRPSTVLSTCRWVGDPVATEGRGGTDRNAESHWDTRWTKRAMNRGKEADMAGNVIVVVVVIAVIVAAVVMVSRQRKSQQARRAESLRSEAGEQSILVRQRESKAAEVDARARAAQAESDGKAAEAERLALTAERQKAEASKQRSDVDDQFRKADAVDPHHDNSLAEEGTTSDGSGQTTPPDTSTTDDRDAQTPR